MSPKARRRLAFFLGNVLLQNFLFSMSHTPSPIQAILLLEDGTVHHGKAFGKKGTTSGEICFNTGMTGYQEVFTDPSYYGQVLIMNSVHIGNYGVKDSDVESDPASRSAD
jgi:carbamoyl-phosphate synthase small subunit